MRRVIWFASLGVALSALGCESTAAKTEASPVLSAEAISTVECASCKMVVREQPAPRAQLVHRDGTRAHFCSIGDLLPYLAAPSPHGKAEAVFVEVLDPAEDPAIPATGEHRWVKAEDAHYVVGVDRPRVMGEPVLTYADERAAREAAKSYSGQTRTFSQLRGGTAKPQH